MKRNDGRDGRDEERERVQNRVAVILYRKKIREKKFF